MQRFQFRRLAAPSATSLRRISGSTMITFEPSKCGSARAGNGGPYAKRILRALYCLLLSCALPLPGEISTNQQSDKFLGALSCSSTACHGGAASNRNQYLIWSRNDFHSRAYATLTTRRSAQMAEMLKVKDPVQESRCTVCHAPFHNVPAERRDPAVRSIEGVSCESCHGPGESWLRSHTRLDLNHADRISAGMRDLRNLYVRANSCIACHQTVASELLEAGHPELIFELDGQAVSQPKHWRELGSFHGPQVWLVGQAAALREMSWQLSGLRTPDQKLLASWRGLLWLLQKVSLAERSFAGLGGLEFNDNPSTEDFKRAQELSDQLARKAEALSWSSNLTSELLRKLAHSAEDFRKSKASRMVNARRAERLVLALDRLLMGMPDDESHSAANTELDRLFKSVQSLPDFNPEQFALGLTQFAEKVKPSLSHP